jgi:hypothetical protein
VRLFTSGWNIFFAAVTYTAQLSVLTDIETVLFIGGPLVVWTVPTIHFTIFCFSTWFTHCSATPNLP